MYATFEITKGFTSKDWASELQVSVPPCDAFENDVIKVSNNVAQFRLCVWANQLLQHNMLYNHVTVVHTHNPAKQTNR